MAILAELLGDFRIPHYLVGVGEHIYMVIAVEGFEVAQPFNRDSDKEIIERRVYLGVSHPFPQVRLQLGVEFLRGDFTLFESEERSFLTIVPKELFGMFQCRGAAWRPRSFLAVYPLLPLRDRKGGPVFLLQVSCLSLSVIDWSGEGYVRV